MPPGYFDSGKAEINNLMDTFTKNIGHRVLLWWLVTMVVLWAFGGQVIWTHVFGPVHHVTWKHFLGVAIASFFIAYVATGLYLWHTKYKARYLKLRKETGRRWLSTRNTVLSLGQVILHAATVVLQLIWIIGLALSGFVIAVFALGLAILVA